MPVPLDQATQYPDRNPSILQQARVLWDKGWGRVIGINSYVEYLKTIPDLPVFPAAWDYRFPHLVLVDSRIAVVNACRMLNVLWGDGESCCDPNDRARSVRAPVYWMRCQDGRYHRSHIPEDCRMEFSSHGDEVGCEVHEGLALYAQFPNLLEAGTAWDLPGSVRADLCNSCPYLKRWSPGFVTLSLGIGGRPSPNYGSVSRGSADLSLRS